MRREHQLSSADERAFAVRPQIEFQPARYSGVATCAGPDETSSVAARGASGGAWSTSTSQIDGFVARGES